MEKTEKATTGQSKPSFGERIKDTVQQFGARLKGMVQKEPDMHEGETQAAAAVRVGCAVYDA